MADKQICGENECVISHGGNGKPVYAPAGTPFKPGVVIGKFVDDPTPAEPAFPFDALSLLGFFCLFLAAFSFNRYRKAVRSRTSRSG